jgi:hypothetical protein
VDDLAGRTGRYLLGLRSYSVERTSRIRRVQVDRSRGRTTPKWQCVRMSTPPVIRPVQWITAREVLGGEASDFTPWLQQPESMAILGRALKLEDLRAIAVEHNVLGKRLDILAEAIDENGEDVPVCIENQYGESDADHLGRLIAYLAQQERGRAVWIVERAHEAFVAAVRFLNRTTTDDVGYYLAEVRFTHGAEGTYQVHFEVLAAPIDWERAGRRHRTGRPVNPDRKAFLDAIVETLRPSLLGANCPNIVAHKRGTYANVKWPLDHWARTVLSRRFTINATKNETLVKILVELFQTREANTAAVDIVRSRLGATLEAALPPGSTVAWAAGQGGHRDVVTLATAGGWADGNVDDAAAWADAASRAVIAVLADNPIPDLVDLVAARVPDAALGGDLEDDLLED